MKFNVSSATLCNRLQTLSRVLASKNSIQILDRHQMLSAILSQFPFFQILFLLLFLYANPNHLDRHSPLLEL